jgi:hypothetical protein
MFDAVTPRLAQEHIRRRATRLMFAEMRVGVGIEDGHENSLHGGAVTLTLCASKSLTSSG